MFKFVFLLTAFPLLTLALAENDQVIHRPFYSLSYNEKHEVANWVDYSLEVSQLRKCVERTNSFKSDPLIVTGSAELADYRNSGYDRGHLLPAGDMRFDRQAMLDTFYLSNMTPQPSSFNSGKWSSLENLIRAWAFKYKKIWIVTGPVLNNHLPYIGVNNHVSIPTEYFKVVLKQNQNGYEGIGFLMQTTIPFPDLVSYAVDIDTVEELTKLDFFSYLDDSVEEEVERRIDLEKWDFKAKFSYLPCEAI